MKLLDWLAEIIGVPRTSLSVKGSDAAQRTSDESGVQPFLHVTAGGVAGQAEAVKITLVDSRGAATDANGVLSGAGLAKTGTGTYALTAPSPVALTTALDALVFTPTAHEVAPGNVVATTLKLTLTQGAYRSVDAAIPVAVTAVNDPPTISGTQAGQVLTDQATLHPFYQTAIGSVDVGVTEKLTITLLDSASNPTDANGSLSGTGLVKSGVGTYTLTAGSPAAVTAALEAVIFTPTRNEVPVGDSVTTHMVLSVAQGGAITTDSTTSVIATAQGSVPSIAAQWDGIDSTAGGGSYPPDNALAVGLGTVVSAENNAIQWSNLSGGAATTQALETFFAPVLASGYFLTDPQVVYDATNQRFVVTIDEINNQSTASNLLLAVSKDSNPADGWNFESWNTSYMVNGAATMADQPFLCVDGQNIYVTTAQFSAASGNYVGEVLTTFSCGLSGGLYAGGNSPGTTANFSEFTYQPAAVPGGGAYFISYSATNQVSIFKSTPNPDGSNSLTAPATLSLGSIDNGNGTYTATQPGTHYLLDAGDGRITSAAYANGSLYALFEVMPVGATTPALHWVQIDVSNPTSPALVAQGDILGGTISSGAATFNGSIAVDGAGDVIINFNASGPSLLPTDYFMVHQAGTAAGAFTAPTVYHASATFYVDPGQDSIGRWGDYSTAIADPNNAQAFWISSEFVSGSSSWGTAIAHVSDTLTPLWSA